MKTEQRIGLIKWVATEGETHTVIDEGETNVSLNDVTINEMTGLFASEGSHEKLIRLGDKFTFGISGTPSDSSDITGFGLTASYDAEESTNSWEWFDVDTPKHANKRQGTGEVAFTAEKIGSKWEIARIEFLTDVSMRIMRVDFSIFKLTTKGFGIDFDWRLRIREGSVIIWPSLVNGAVVMNGHL